MLKIYVDLFNLMQSTVKILDEKVKSFSREESGVTAVEYALIVALVAIAITAAATTLGTNVSNLFNRAACSVRSGTWNAVTNICT